jgi:hypothetical protein
MSRLQPRTVILLTICAGMSMYMYMSVSQNMLEAKIGGTHFVQSHVETARSEGADNPNVRGAPPPARRARKDNEPSEFRDFCNVTADQTPPNRPTSKFIELTSSAVRQAAEKWAKSGDRSSLSKLDEFKASLAAESPCFWANYSIPKPGQPLHTIPFCTHDPAADLISRSIHKSKVWFQASMYEAILRRMPEGCPPDRPVAVDLGLNIGSWSMYALERGCHVIAFDAVKMNVQRVAQTVLAAKRDDGHLYGERFYGFWNGVGNTVGNVTIHVNFGNVGASVVKAGLPLDNNYTHFVQTVHLEDLLYNMPEDERPQIRVGHKDANDNWVYAIMKVDVEGFDVPALHSLRRMFEGPVNERPVAFTAELYPPLVPAVKCNPVEFARFMYDAGYKYEHRGAYVEREAMIRGVNASRYSVKNSTRTFEGWWDLVLKPSD